MLNFLEKDLLIIYKTAGVYSSYPLRDTSLFLEWGVFEYLRLHNFSPYTPMNLRPVIQKGFHECIGPN
jgi:hypothetical protein